MKNYLFLLIVIFITSCSMPAKRGNTPDEIKFNLIEDLYNEGRYILVNFEASEFKKNFPHSDKVADVDYFRCLALDRSMNKSPQLLYSTWLDFKKMHPKYKKEVIEEKLRLYKGKKDPVPNIGFIEFSYLGEISSNSKLDSLSNDKISGYDFSYYSHEGNSNGLGFFFSLSGQSYDDVKISEYASLNQTFFTFGTSYKYKIRKEKLISYFSIGGSLIENSLIMEDKNQKNKAHTSFGAQAKLSFDVLLFRGGYSIKRNDFYYLTFGISAHYAPSVEIENIKIPDTTNITWFTGFKF